MHTHTYIRTQVLQVAVNKSKMDSENIPEFIIEWGGRTSEALSVLDLETDSSKQLLLVVEEVHDLVEPFFSKFFPLHMIVCVIMQMCAYSFYE